MAMESNEENTDEQGKNKTEHSPSSESSGKDSQDEKSKDVGHSPSSLSPQNNLEKTTPSSCSSLDKSSLKFIPLIVVIISVLIYRYKYYAQPIISMPGKIDRIVEDWKIAFPNLGEEVWSTIEAQMADFMEQESAPLIFVLSYNEGNEKTVKHICSALSQFAVKLKHNEDECGDNDESKLRGNDPLIKESLLDSVLPLIQKCKKMIVYNLEEMSPSAAQDLHSLLDMDNPNVKSAVYIFTVQVPSNVDLSLYHSVSNILKERWSTELNDDVLSPILSRLINFIKITV